MVAGAVAAAAGVDRSGWAGATRSAELVALLAARERLDALILAVAGEWDADQAWAADGAVSPVAWLAHRAPLTRQDASVLVRTARHARRFTRTGKALDAGDVTAAHVTVAARAARHREEHYAEHEDTVLDVAGRLPVTGFRRVMAYWRSCVDAVADHEDARDQVDGGYLEVSATFGGVGHLEGRLDPIATAALTAALDRLEPPDPADGPRPPRPLAQRRAAALVRLVTGDRPPPVRIDVLLDEHSLAGRPDPDPTRRCCDVVGLGPVPVALARTLACDAAIGRVVLRGESEVLDVGRRTRLVTPALRRALDARDRGCVEPGCTTPAHWCDAHHVRPWWAHGTTDVANLELRCRRHHLAAHARAHALPRE